MLDTYGFGGLFFWPLGYIIIRVQMEGVQGYNKDQVTLVRPYSTVFEFWVPVTLGTLTINWIINVIKESKIDELSAYLNGLRISCLIACHHAELSVRSEAAAKQTVDPTDLNEAVKTTNHTQANKKHALGRQHACNDADPEGGDGPHLPHGLIVMNTYTKVTAGSKWVAVVVKNLMAIPITIAKGIKVVQLVAVNAVPQVEVAPRTLEKLDEIQGIQQSRMSVEQRREVVFQQLDLTGLEQWSDKNQVATCTLVAEYHNIFSLDPGELGCTDLTKHKIRIVDNKPFKERFWRIPPPMVDEVQAHMK